MKQLQVGTAQRQQAPNNRGAGRSQARKYGNGLGREQTARGRSAWPSQSWNHFCRTSAQRWNPATPACSSGSSIASAFGLASCDIQNVRLPHFSDGTLQGGGARAPPDQLRSMEGRCGTVTMSGVMDSTRYLLNGHPKLSSGARKSARAFQQIQNNTAFLHGAPSGGRAYLSEPCFSGICFWILNAGPGILPTQALASDGGTLTECGVHRPWAICQSSVALPGVTAIRIRYPNRLMQHETCAHQSE